MLRLLLEILIGEDEPTIEITRAQVGKLDNYDNLGEEEIECSDLFAELTNLPRQNIRF